MALTPKRPCGALLNHRKLELVAVLCRPAGWVLQITMLLREGWGAARLFGGGGGSTVYTSGSWGLGDLGSVIVLEDRQGKGEAESGERAPGSRLISTSQSRGQTLEKLLRWCDR